MFARLTFSNQSCFMNGGSANTVKPVIKGVHAIPMGFSNAFLIEGDDGLTLIDAGSPNKEAAVFGAIRRLSRSPDQLKHLIFTHGRPDHIGSAAAIVRGTGTLRCPLHFLLAPVSEYDRCASFSKSFCCRET